LQDCSKGLESKIDQIEMYEITEKYILLDPIAALIDTQTEFSCDRSATVG
jgi:hypothetical protein